MIITNHAINWLPLCCYTAIAVTIGLIVVWLLLFCDHPERDDPKSLLSWLRATFAGLASGALAFVIVNVISVGAFLCLQLIY